MTQPDVYTPRLAVDATEAKAVERGPGKPVERSAPRVPAAARLAVTVLFFINGALIGSWVARIPAIKLGLGLGDGVFGLALLAMAGGALAAMPLAGGLSARFGSHRVTQTLALVYAGLLPALAAAPNLWTLVLILFCFGVGHGGLDVGMNAQAVAVQRRYPGSIMSSFHALFSTGGLAGAALGGWLAARGLAPWAHFALMGVGMGALALLTFPHLLDDRERHEGTGKAGAEGAPHPLFVLPTRALAVLGVLAFCAMVGEGAMADWSAIYLRRVLHTGEGMAAAGYAAFSVMMAVTRFSGDGLATRLGPVTLVRLGGALAVAGFALALFVPFSWAVFVGFAGVGAGFATVVPMAFSAAGRTPGMAAGMALASVTTLGYLGFLIGPPIIGFAAEIIGLRNALMILVGTSALVLALAPSVRERR